MPNLYNALLEHESLRLKLLEQWPELSEDEIAQEDTLEGLSSFNEVLAGVLRSAIQDDMLAAGVQEYIQRLQLRRKRIQERAERKKAIALHYASEGRVQKVGAPDLTASVVMGSGKVIVRNESDVPDEYWRTKREIDLAKISKDQRSGIDVKGADRSNPEPHWVIRT